MRTVLFILFSLAFLLPTLTRSQEMVPIPRPGKNTAAKARPEPLTFPSTPPGPAPTGGTAAPSRPATAPAPAPAPASPARRPGPPPGDAAPAAPSRNPGDTSAAAAPDSAAAAPADTAKNDTVAYSASRIRYRNDRFSLSDKALLTYKGSSMVADSIVYWSEDNIVEAMGAPLIQDPQNPPILGYKMRYNLKTKVGEIYYGSSKKGNQTFAGVEVRRQANGDILIARGDFSTCDLPEKHYYFYGRRMILEPKAKVLSGPIVMDIAEVPVAVLPMMVMPLGTGRRSGLLQPKFGGDQSLGFYMNNLGYYWAISDYMDWVASADVVEGQSGTFDKTNLNSTYRYNVRYLLEGYLKGTYYVSEFDPSRAGWSIDYANNWNITPDGKQKLTGSGTFVSEPGIIQDNALTEADASKQTANANLGYTRNFDALGARLGLTFNQIYNLTTGYLERTFPNATLSMSGPLFPEDRDEEAAPGFGDGKDPWYRKLEWSYKADGNAFYRRLPATATSAADTNTFVGYLDHLTLSGKFAMLQYFNLNPRVDFGQHWSLDSRDPSAPGGSRNAWDPGAGDLGEYFPTFSTSLSTDTRIYGIAQAENHPWFGTVRGLRHTIIPSLGFTYAPEIDSNPRLVSNPSINGPVYQAEQRTVNLSLGNEVSLKLAGKDTAGAGAGGTSGNAAGGGAAKKDPTYNLATTSSTLNYNFAAPVREWSDLSSSITLYPTPNIPFTLSATHSLYDDFAGEGARDELTSPILKSYSFGWRRGLEAGGDFSSGARVRDSRGFPRPTFEHTPWSASLNYSFSFSSTRVGGGDEDPLSRFFGVGGTFRQTRTHSANGSLKLNPTAGWQMAYDTDYDFSLGRFSRHAFSFHRTLHCWVMDFRWNPVGISEGWSFVIRITELPDIKLESSDTQTGRRRRR